MSQNSLVGNTVYTILVIYDTFNTLGHIFHSQIGLVEDNEDVYNFEFGFKGW